LDIFEEAFARFTNKFFIAMKKFLITGLAIMLSSGALMAQYDDDAYAPSSNRPATQEESYNDGNGSRERYSEYDENDGYIDYDDDSYTTRFRRFNSMYMGYNYWSPMYSPYWANPYYSDPFWYRPGFSFSWGLGYNPYWGSGWGWNSYWGYGGGYGWGYPYWGSAYGAGWGYPYYGGGWNNGWNGDGGRYGRNVNTGTRTGFGSARSSSFGVRPAPGAGNPNPGNSGGYVRRGAPGTGNVGNNNGNPGRVNPSNNSGYMRNPGTNGGVQRMRDNNAPAPRYNRGNDVNPPQQYDRGNSRPEPSRNYTPAPSRSFDNGGGGSRGGGGFNSGGGSRGGGGGGYRR
jgi:hypothetical protein